MKTTIYKYPLKIDDKQEVSMPFGAQILCCQTQDETVCLWAMVDTRNSEQKRTIEIFGTGHHIPTDMGMDRRYIGTAQQASGQLVWHVFERL